MGQTDHAENHNMILWPTQAEARTFYGDPEAPNWQAVNLTRVKCPWTLCMGKDIVSGITIHVKCAPSLVRVLGAVWDAVGHDPAKITALHYDRYDGSFNYRPMRGGHSLSMHSYGCAIDWDAAENEQHSTKHLFTDDSLLIVKFKEEGWQWGGDWSAVSVDAMHVQAARVK